MSKQTNAIAVSTIGIDTGKNTLHMIGLDEKGEIVLRERVSRSRIAARLVNVRPCLVGIELAWPVASENPIQLIRGPRRIRTSSPHDCNRPPIRPPAVRLLQAATPAGSRDPGAAASTQLLRRRAPRRPHLRWADRALFIWLYRRCPRILSAITVARPETVLRWHRMGFVAYWRWKSRSTGADRGSPKRCAL